MTVKITSIAAENEKKKLRRVTTLTLHYLTSFRLPRKPPPTPQKNLSAKTSVLTEENKIRVGRLLFISCAVVLRLSPIIQTPKCSWKRIHFFYFRTLQCNGNITNVETILKREEETPIPEVKMVEPDVKLAESVIEMSKTAANDIVQDVRLSLNITY